MGSRRISLKNETETRQYCRNISVEVERPSQHFHAQSTPVKRLPPQREGNDNPRYIGRATRNALQSHAMPQIGGE